MQTGAKLSADARQNDWRGFRALKDQSRDSAGFEVSPARQSVHGTLQCTRLAAEREPGADQLVSGLRGNVVAVGFGAPLDPNCVEHHARQLLHGTVGQGQPRRAGVAAIAEQRRAVRRSVDAQLVRSTGDGREREQ